MLQKPYKLVRVYSNMENFIYQNQTKIILDKDTENQNGEEIKNYSKKILHH